MKKLTLKPENKDYILTYLETIVEQIKDDKIIAIGIVTVESNGNFNCDRLAELESMAEMIAGSHQLLDSCLCDLNQYAMRETVGGSVA